LLLLREHTTQKAMAPFALTKLQNDFIKVVVVTNENFLTWV
jgi:hypothetical protein